MDYRFVKYYLLLVVFFIFATLDGNAQISKAKSVRAKTRTKDKLSWIFGLGWNAIDDDGKPYTKLFDVVNSWNMPGYPSQISAELIGKSGFTFGTTFSYNNYKSNKIINNKEVTGSYKFFCIDVFAKHHIKGLLKLNSRLDPYAIVGLGYTLRFIEPYSNTNTLNLGLGFTFWLNSYVGLNLQSIAKFGLRFPFYKTGSNYLQHSGGFVFILDRTHKKKYTFIKSKYPWVLKKNKTLQSK